MFLDEISRCRPEVQNKLFSIVHEKRVQGVALDSLRYRWAAMNPPGASDSSDDQDVYVGSLPLDPALADRFGFVLTLPALDDLSPEARRLVIRSGLVSSSLDIDKLDVPALVAACRHRAGTAASLDGDWITAYTATLVVPLRQAGLAISGRRAAILAANVAAVHGARQVLAEDGAVADAALVALRLRRAGGRTTVQERSTNESGQSCADAQLWLIKGVCGDGSAQPKLQDWTKVVN